MFLDASAIVAILAREPDAETLLATIRTSPTKLYFSPLSLYEAATSLARAKTAGQQVEPETIAGALEAAQRCGRAVGHPARLNLGDCFVYACARSAGVSLLYKGDDFARTDLA